MAQQHQQGRTEQRQQNFHREHLRPMLCAKGAGGTLSRAVYFSSIRFRYWPV